ncbi:MAG: hypothetical protein ACTSRA_01105, partial [Promethearchaeota archaeon]
MKNERNKIYTINCNSLMKKMRDAKMLRTGIPELDEILTPTRLDGFEPDNKTTRDKGIRKTYRRCGISQGMLHLLAGPPALLSKITMQIAVVAFLPTELGGINATSVFYFEMNNHFDPYHVSRFAAKNNLDPSFVLDRIYIARGFNWDQAVEIVAEYLPKAVTPNTAVIISGITTFFDPRVSEHFKGINEMIQGIKKCIEKTRNVYFIATSRIAPGSTFKPHGGNALNHFAGVVITINKKELKSGT